MYQKILIIQTAFLGDVILSLPIVQVLKNKFPNSRIDFLCIPEPSELLKYNPYVNEVITFDKRKTDKGFGKLFKLILKLRKSKYDLIVSPHRSFRSALISFYSKAKKTVSFDKSSLSFLYDVIVRYNKGIHEIQRNLSLLKSIEIESPNIIPPDIFISNKEIETINNLLKRVSNNDLLITIAPGSVWFTKRFPEEKFIKLINLLSNIDCKIFLIGGKKDVECGKYIEANTESSKLVNVIGKLSLLESAELIKRSSFLITNDSAPLHIANSVRTKVVAIFGSTIPEFGFFPYGKDDKVFEIKKLKCRPCTDHGRQSCPIETFDCINLINEEDIYLHVKNILLSK